MFLKENEEDKCTPVIPHPRIKPKSQHARESVSPEDENTKGHQGVGKQGPN